MAASRDFINARTAQINRSNALEREEIGKKWQGQIVRLKKRIAVSFVFGLLIGVFGTCIFIFL